MSEVKSQPSVNLMQALPAALLRSMLRFVAFADLGMLLTVSKAMRLASIEHAKLRSSFEWHDDQASFGPRTAAAVWLLQHCRQLQTINLGDLVWYNHHEQLCAALRRILPRLVRNNAASLQRVHATPSVLSMSVLEELAACSNLSSFDDAGVTENVSDRAYSAAVLRILRSCRSITELSLGHNSLDVGSHVTELTQDVSSVLLDSKGKLFALSRGELAHDVLRCMFCGCVQFRARRCGR